MARNGKFWIIAGGDWDGTWEIVVKASSAQKAVDLYRQYRDAQARTINQRNRKMCEKKGLPFFPPNRNQLEAAVFSARLNRFGVIESTDIVMDQVLV